MYFVLPIYKPEHPANQILHSVLRRYIVQIASSLPVCLCHAVSRSLLDLHRQLIQYHLQAPFPRFLRLHDLPNDNSLQAHPRPKHRHVPGTIPSGGLSITLLNIPLRLHTFRNPLGLQYLARVGRHPPPALLVAKNRRGRDHHNSLPVCVGNVQSALYTKLDLAILG